MIGNGRPAFIEKLLKLALSVRHTQIVEETSRVGPHLFRHVPKEVGAHRMKRQNLFEIIRPDRLASRHVLEHV